MCGFAGIWTYATNADALQASVLAMADAIAHRGPDDVGVWCDPSVGVAVAHRRLAILDLSPAGHQPMSSSSDRYVLAFNGEIYNHLDIRRELEQAGLLQQSWRGHSDTETLLAAIESWGLVATLQRCAGMFALVLWDRCERVLHLARDRFGEKPLYWGWLQQAGQNVLTFASDLAALRALPGTGRLIVNRHALSVYFQRGCIPAPLCIYSGLQQLAAGCLVRIPAVAHSSPPSQLAEPFRWWDPVARSAQLPQVATLGGLQAVLEQAVAEQAIADVPLGSFLSGGIDSSLITALLQSVSRRPVRSFTVAFPDSPGSNEAPYACAVARHLGTDHTEVPLTAGDALGVIPHLPRLYSEPFADSSQLPTHLVCHAARQSGLTVALTGDGGDELFGGYNRHRLIPLLHRRLGTLPPLVRRAITRGLDKLPLSSRGLARDKRRKLVAAIRAAESLEHLYASLTSVYDDSSVLLQPQWQPFAAPASRPPLPLAPTVAEQLMLADVLTYLPADILVKVDRAAMAASLETRSPYLDHRVAEVAWQLPLSLKIRGGVSKWALRQLLERYVPRQLIDRPKAGFAMPIGVWLRGPLRHWADELLSPALLSQHGYLQPEPVQLLWNAHLSGADHTPQLWAVLMWQAWLSEWLD
jgi:asparagine synthase (glutamine-hydrolysing)